MHHRLVIEEISNEDLGMQKVAVRPRSDPGKHSLDSKFHYDKVAEIAELNGKGIHNRESVPFWQEFLETQDMQHFNELAYANERPFAIRTDPVTGVNQLYIAGSRDKADWHQNFAEGLDDVTHTHISEAYRESFAADLDDIVKQYDIKMIFAHSRGAAVMSEMHSEGVTYIGLDGASYIGDHKEYVNLQNQFGFDRLIGAGHKGNVHIPGTAFHKVWRESDRFNHMTGPSGKTRGWKSAGGTKSFQKRKYFDVDWEKTRKHTAQEMDEIREEETRKKRSRTEKGKIDNLMEDIERKKAQDLLKKAQDRPLSTGLKKTEDRKKYKNFDNDFGKLYSKLPPKEQEQFEKKFIEKMKEFSGSKGSMTFKRAQFVYSKQKEDQRQYFKDLYFEKPNFRRRRR